MKRFFKDRTALGFAVAGMILMAFTIAWRINPVEGSVVPQFLRDNPLGVAVHGLLLVTCMPVWIATMILLSGAGDRVTPWLGNFGMVFLQGLVYFLLGKGVSLCLRKLLMMKKCRAAARVSNQTPL